MNSINADHAVNPPASSTLPTDEKPHLLTPSKVSAWLDCPHYLTLKHSGARATNGGAGEFARLLMDKGLEHERACLAHYESSGVSIIAVPDRRAAERFEDWVQRVGDVMAQGADVIYQMPFIHNGMRGIADFLLKVELDDGSFTYEPLDAKLARKEAKPGHVLQLCFYADAIEAAGYARPRDVHIWLGSGHIESIRLHEVVAYWRRIQQQLATAMAPPHDAPPTTPVKCDYCQFCEFADGCEQVWRDADALQFVAGIRRTEIATFEAASIANLAALAAQTDEVAGVPTDRRVRLAAQAALQVRAREMPDGSVAPHHGLSNPTSEETAAGIAALPAPDPGDVFLDYEGHPFWRADRGLFFLFGLLTRNGDGWTYEARWAHSEAEEGQQAKALIEYFAARRQQFPGMHVYHYNHTERSALESMAAEHGADQTLLQHLVETGLFVDLFGVVRNSLQAGVESYGLKSMERLAQYERNHEIDKGAGAVVGYERYMSSRAAAELAAIEVYNEDDVRATMALRDWLVSERDTTLPWRDPVLQLAESKYPEIDAQVATLLGFDAGTPEHLMGELLGYWLRESRANTAQVLAKAGKDPSELLDDPEAISGLEFVALVDRVGKRGQLLADQGALFRFPPQELGSGLDPARTDQAPTVCFRIDDATPGWGNVDQFSATDGTVRFIWNAKLQEQGLMPSSVVLNSWVAPHPKPATLLALADDLINGTMAPSATDALLRAAPPVFVAGGGPTGGVFTDNTADIARWVLALDHSYLPIQGPPGTGKTYTGAHIVHALVRAGRRVGITAMSHSAIDNLLQEVVEVAEAGDLSHLRVVRKGAKTATPDIPGLVKASTNDKCADLSFNVVAGTTWLFANDAMVDAPVDVLIVDEAGQLGLADALAASRSAKNIVLLGDPLQLPQVSQATHPGGSGKSVLEHVIGPDNATVAEDRGVFLSETRRMHPDVCRFISDEIYDGRLSSHPSCAVQGTAFGTGLRWLQTHHEGRSTRSPEEADLVMATIEGLVGTYWTDREGATAELLARDVMVVAPYNDQVRYLKERFSAVPGLAEVKVGTVDKFQGQQAPVVFFTMTSSSAEDMPRGADFLFSRNRLNVALSRARCLAFVVCTEELLNSRARTVDEMKLISTLCAAVDYAVASGS